MAFNYAEEGFRSPPDMIPAKGDERLFRAYGGKTTLWGNPKGSGVFFSFAKPRSRWEAEQFCSAMEYGNAFYFIATFSVPKNLPLWVGDIDEGQYAAPSLLGKTRGQVFIEKGYMKDVRLLVEKEVLKNDLGDYQFVPHIGNA